MPFFCRAGIETRICCESAWLGQSMAETHFHCYALPLCVSQPPLRVQVHILFVDTTCALFFFIKVASFQKVRFVFQISKSPQKKVFKKTILNLKFKIPAHNSIMLWAGILNFKFRIVFWNISFGRLEIWKNKKHWKKATFS